MLRGRHGALAAYSMKDYLLQEVRFSSLASSQNACFLLKKSFSLLLQPAVQVNILNSLCRYLYVLGQLQAARSARLFHSPSSGRRQKERREVVNFRSTLVHGSRTTG